MTVVSAAWSSICSLKLKELKRFTEFTEVTYLRGLRICEYDTSSQATDGTHPCHVLMLLHTKPLLSWNQDNKS